MVSIIGVCRLLVPSVAPQAHIWLARVACNPYICLHCQEDTSVSIIGVCHLLVPYHSKVERTSFHQFEKTYSFIKLFQGIVSIKKFQSIVFIKLYRSMVPTDKSSDVLHLQGHFCRSDLYCSTLLLLLRQFYFWSLPLFTDSLSPNSVGGKSSNSLS